MIRGIFVGGLIGLMSVVVCAGAFGGTYSQFDTLIPVPESATGTATGDTSPTGTSTIHLDARVYIPDGLTAPAPAMVVVHGYGGSKDDGTVTAVAQDFASAGYVVLTPTMRGFGDSDGLVTLGGPNEVNDLKTMILAMQTGHIGDSPAVAIPVNASSKFGVAGASYGGGHAFEIMRTHVAGLTAVAPVIGWTDLYQALAPNDVPKLSYGIALFASGFDTQHPNYDDQMFNWLQDMLSGKPEETRKGDSQSDLDWRSVIFNPTQLTVPAFVIQGWHDWLFPAEQATTLFQSNTAIPFFKMYLGGLGHPPASTDITTPEAMYLRAQLLRWFDYWLKGIDNGIVNEPRVTIAPERTTSWSETSLTTSNTFPLPGASTATYFLNGSRLASATSTKAKSQIIKPGSGLPAVLQPIEQALGQNGATLIGVVIAANAAINSNSDIFSSSLATGQDDSANSIQFTTTPLAQNIHVMGVPQFHLFVSATNSNAYYYAELFEVDSDGNEHFVTRSAFKDHTKKFSAVHEIDFGAFATNRTFQAGSRIEVRVASRDFPFFFVSPNQPTLKVYQAKKHPSRVDLPTVP